MSKIIVEPIEKYGLSKKARKRTLFSKIGIVGCGREGQNIARIAAFFGIEVAFVELTKEKIENALTKISRELDNRIETWGLTETEKKTIMGRISGSMDYKSLSDCDFVIEAIRSDNLSERQNIQPRKQIFKEVEEMVSDRCIIATNATSAVISELASDLKLKDRTVGIHFFISSPEARVVEVVKGIYTSEDAYNRVRTFVNLVNREVIPVQESAGLVGVRIFMVMLNEACDVLMEGVATKEAINRTTMVGFGFRFGVFHVADIMGLEKIERWGENLFEEFGDERYKPSPLIKRLVRAKRLGVNAGQGFFKYDEHGKRIEEEI